MSFCSKCSIVKRMEEGGEVVLYSPQPYIISRLEASDLGADSSKLHHTTLVLKVTCFREFVQNLNRSVSLTQAEQEHLHIAHVAPGEAYGPDLLSKVRPLAQWVYSTENSRLLKILRDESLTVHFQPVVDLDRNRLYGYECLSRGVADGSLVSPGLLIQDARKMDLLFNLDLLMRKTCLKSASNADIEDHLFINFLPSAVYNPEFCLRETTKLIDSLQIDPKRIVFEVVETEQVEDSSHLIKILNYYRDAGYKIALDDVAAGYSGLLQLLMLRPDIMKIDRAIIDGIHLDEAKQTIFKAMMIIANDYGIDTLAEGIETREDLDYLKANGVSMGQGYYLGKPDPVPRKVLIQ